MSQQVQQWKSPRAKRRYDRQQADAAAEHREKVRVLAEKIPAVLKHKRNQGVVYAYTYDMLLLAIAREIGFGPGAKSQHQLSKDYQAFMAGDQDRHISRNQQRRQGNNRNLMHEAVEFARTRKWIMRHDEDDGMVALHLPGKQPPRWTVFFATARQAAHDYIPSEEELRADSRTADEYLSDESYVLTGRALAQLRAWDEPSAL